MKKNVRGGGIERKRVEERRGKTGSKREKGRSRRKRGGKKRGGERKKEGERGGGWGRKKKKGRGREKGGGGRKGERGGRCERVAKDLVGYVGKVREKKNSNEAGKKAKEEAEPLSGWGGEDSSQSGIYGSDHDAGSKK